jgi:hypothetical protein
MKEKKKLRIACWLLWFVLAGALPAGANLALDVFGSDAFTSLLLVFPITILGFRLAGARLTQKEKKWRIPLEALLAFCVIGALVSPAIAELGGALYFLLAPCVVLYGVVRGVQAIRRGQGAKRSALGGAVVLLAVLLGINALIASQPLFPGPGRLASSAVSKLRTINTAAVTYISTYENGLPPSLAVLGAPATGAPDCKKADLTDPVMAADGNAFVRTGYLYEYRPGPPVEKPVPGCPPGVKSYTASARPLKYGAEQEVSPWFLLPGSTLLRLRRGDQVPFQRFTFATDETGVLRRADLGTSRPVTREEVQKWVPVGQP